ncbi:HlyD family efflux transporter periplasmic adaptor subunit [Pseudotabrizicola sp. L79]|uniref:HlyD family efflux transporter periplasmic adaptor subunit n=1 Tax=Pseudotabrizicola sp. L79 TaxID=3118402 RepID=UPI002F95EDBB
MTDTPKTDADLPLPVAKPDPAPGKAGRRFRKRYLLVLLVPVLMFSGGVMGMYFQPPGLKVFYQVTGLTPGAGSDSPIALPPEIDLPKDMAETMRPTDVLGLARLMPRGDVAVVAAPYGAGDARVAAVLVAIGDRVTKGQAVARLDNSGVLESAVLLAEANLAVREATLMQTKSTVQISRDEAQATLDQAQAAAEEASSQRQRSEDLFQRSVATQATLDAARASERQALAAVAKAEATLARYTAIALDDQPDVIVASRNLDAARADLDRAKADLARAMVMAPIDGTVLDIHATPGQRPPTEGILEMGNTDVMMAEAEIWQDRIVQVAVGQPVELAAPALGRTFQGRVDSIGLTVGRQGLISDDTAANTDARVVKVMVALDQESSAMAARFTNLEVIARIDTHTGPTQ